MKIKRKTKLLRLAGITLLILPIFALQIQPANQLNLLFPIIYVMIFFTSSELFGTRVGTYTSILIIVLNLLFFKNQYLPVISLQMIATGYYFIIRIVRENKLEKALERENYLKTLMNANLQPLIIKDKEGKLFFMSESIYDLLGLKKESWEGQDISEFVHPNDLGVYRSFIDHVVRWPNEKKSLEFRIKKGDDWIWVRSDSKNLLKNKEIKAIITSIQDVTTQKSIDRQKAEIIENEKGARKEAEKAVRDRDEFLSIASHELKTPLTTVLLQLQATLRKILTQSLADFSGKELLGSLQIAEKQSKSLAALIKDLLNVSLASTGRITLNKEKVNLADVVNSLEKRYEEEIKLSKSHVVTEIKDTEIIGNWDPIRIEQAISNLLMNALKYGGGKVTLIAKKDDKFGIFQVKDKGKGIPTHLQKEIFEPFKRANENTSTKGLGVGLFIASQIANAHRGSISVRSELGKGSTFTLQLPLE